MEDHERRELRHDTLGCLNSIKLCVEVLATTEDRDEIIMFLDSISRETVKIEGIMDQLIASATEASS